MRSLISHQLHIHTYVDHCSMHELQLPGCNAGIVYVASVEVRNVCLIVLCCIVFIPICVVCLCVCACVCVCVQAVDHKNIRRRVYDALNVLMAMNIISKEKKEIRWIGLPTNSLQECHHLEVNALLFACACVCMHSTNL